MGLGGWTLSANHFYDGDVSAVYYGDGTRRTTASLPPVSRTVATPSTIGGAVAVGPDGTVYWVDGALVRSLSSAGKVATAAGSGAYGSGGNEGPAVLAQTTDVTALAVAADGSLYLEEPYIDANGDTQGNLVRKITPDGIIHAFAFNGSLPGTFGNYNDSLGDYGPATSASCFRGAALAIAPDGSVYVGCQNAVRKVSADGTISTAATIGQPSGLAVAPDGSVYVAGSLPGQISSIEQIQADGSLLAVAGQIANFGFCEPGGLPDGSPALYTGPGCMNPTQIAVDPAGTLYFVDTEGSFETVRRIGVNGTVQTVVGGSGAVVGGLLVPGAERALATQTGVKNPPIATSPDGSLYVSNGFNQIRRIEQALPGYGLSEYVLPTIDGQSEDTFDATGRHLARIDTRTGVTLEQFSYDPSGRLASVTDVNGLQTTMTYGSGTVTITGPYGVATQLALDATGALANVTDSLGDVWKMTYASGGLLASFTTPTGALHSMTYDTTGRLLHDARPDGASFSLTPQFGASGWSTGITTALGVTTTHSIVSTAPGLVSRSTTDAAGLTAMATQTSPFSTTTTVPDGTTTTTTVGPDPRFGALSPVVTSQVTTLPSGLASTTAVTRTATLDSSSALAEWTEATTTNGNTWTTAYDVAAKTFTTTSPMGRQTTTTLDAAGRPLQSAVPSLAPTVMTYDAQGRLQTSTQGTFTAAGEEEPRTWTFGYDANGYPSLTTDPTGTSTGYQNDTLGRVTTTLLPDGATGTRMLLSGYDGDSNQTSETLPSSAVHGFTYTSVDTLASYVPPSPDPGNWSTLYRYDGDGRIALETRPDGNTIAYGYDTAGRLATLTYPQGTITHTYNPATGQLASLSTSSGETPRIYVRRLPRDGHDVVWHRRGRALVRVRHELPGDDADVERRGAHVRVRYGQPDDAGGRSHDHA